MKLDLKNDDKKFDQEKFDKLISLAFAHKRKTLKNNLSDDIWNKILKYLVDNDINLQVRAEELSVDIYKDFSNLI